MTLAVPCRMRLLAISFVVAVLGGCFESRCPPQEDGTSSCSSTPVQHVPNVADSFSLFVSNQSFALDPVDIRVELDNSLAVTGDFEVEGQHTWVRFDMGLAAGTHRVRVTTRDVADVVLDETFVMDDRKYGVINFWYYPSGSPEPTPPQFSWQITDEAPAFD